MQEREIINPQDAVPMAQTVQDKDRLTVLLRVYHEHRCMDPVSLDIRNSLHLTNKLQPITRRITIDGTPKALETYWLPAESCGLLVIENNGKEEVLIAPGFTIPPQGPPFVGWPTDMAQILVQTRGEPCTITYHIFPR